MDPIPFGCPACSASLKVRAEAAGKRIKCPRCGAIALVPTPSLSPVPGDGAASLPEPIQTSPPSPADEPTHPPEARPDATLDHERENAEAGDDAPSLTDFLAPPQHPGEIGRLGPYRVLKVLGKGGMGVVYLAEDPDLERRVALKAMLPSLAASGSAKKRFLREAKAAAGLKHDHVVSIYQVGEDRGAPFLAMEFLPGEPLDVRLKRDKLLPLADVLRIGREIALGLAAAHQSGLVHRDIKPGNIWLEARGDRREASNEASSLSSSPSSHHFRVKILDFGLARSANDQTHITQSGAIVGTPAYMAPEQARGGAVDHRCDLFSLGVVLYRLTTGEMPFRGNDTLAILSSLALDHPTPPLELRPDLSPELSELILKLLAKEPAVRIQTADEIVAALQIMESAGPDTRFTSRRPPPRWLVTQASPRRNGLLAALGLGFVALLLTIALLYWNRQEIVAPRPPDERPARVVPPLIEPGWVQLFNGKDLMGWKSHPIQPEGWSVEDGLLVGTGSPVTHLFTQRGDFGDFHLRIEVKISHEGNSGVFFRTPLMVNKSRRAGSENPRSLEFQIADMSTKDSGDPYFTGGISPLANATENRLQPERWHIVELIAKGNRYLSKIDGVQVGDCVDDKRQHLFGHLALQAWGGKTVVQFKKIEIKDLPPSEPGWAQLFNGENLDGWKYHSKHPGEWTVKDGVLTSGGSANYLYTERDDYTDYHLRAMLYLEKGFSAIHCRAPFGSTWSDNFNQPGLNGYSVRISDAFSSTPTGSIREAGPEAAAPLNLAPADSWCLLEILVRGNRIETLVNGKSAASFVDAKAANKHGHIALQMLNPNVVVRFRKIEIKELTPAIASAPFSAAKAKAHQEAWAKHLGVAPEIANSLGMKLRLIPPGKFTMGYTTEQADRALAMMPSPAEKKVIASTPAKTVTVNEPFYLGVHEVTVAQFRRFVNATGYKTTAERTGKGGHVYDPSVMKVAQKPEWIWSYPWPWWDKLESVPVILVSVEDAEAFCTWLGKVEGKTYTLPGEEQWEFACRAGTETLWWSGDDEGVIQRSERVGKGVFGGVGKFVANPLGLHDMHGSVAEWVRAGNTYITRGYVAGSQILRSQSAFRYDRNNPDRADSYTGFRVAVVGDLARFAKP